MLVAAMALGYGEAAGAEVGEAAPALALPDRAGRPVALADFAGTVVVVDFWASWCLPCRAALPALDRLARDRGDALVVLAVSIDRDRAAAERVLADLPASALRALFDPGGRAMARWGAAGMPATYVVDGAGVIRVAASGYEADGVAGLLARIADVLAAARAPTPSGR